MQRNGLNTHRLIKFCILGSASFPLYSVASVEPAPIVFDNGIAATPTLILGISHDDNITSQGKESDSISSFLYTVEPSIALIGEVRNHEIYSSIGAGYGRYTSSREDDYFDYFANVGANLNLGAKQALDIEASFKREHESRGDGISEGAGNLLIQPIELDRVTFDGIYSYGAEEAKGKLSFGAGFEEVVYQNYRVLNGPNQARSTRFKDFDAVELTGALTIKAHSALNSFLEVRSKKTDYTFSKNQNNRLNLYYLGANWDLTGKTSGFAKFGYQDKKFSNQSNDFSSFSWNIGLTWNPSEHATIGFDSSRIAEDPSAISGYNDTIKYGIFWQHHWLERLNTRFSLTSNNEKFNSDSRTDDTITYGVSANYDIRRWLSISFGVDVTDKSSSEENIAYDQLVAYTAVTMSL
nr:outer membrane beta-barrel protein [Grimontia sedimenti]